MFSKFMIKNYRFPTVSMNCQTQAKINMVVIGNAHELPCKYASFILIKYSNLGGTLVGGVYVCNIVM